jgi:hypothetical protein
VMTPQAMGVVDKFCLVSETSPSVSLELERLPYGRAIQEFSRVSNYRTPAGKLDCFIRTSDEICQSIIEYWGARGIDATNSEELAIGSDHLLPIFEYVMVKAQVPFILSEVLFVEEFLTENVMRGAEGFIVATLQTALNYLETTAQPIF